MKLRGALPAALLLASCAARIEHVEIVTVAPGGTAAVSSRTAVYQEALTLVLDALQQELGLPRLDVSLVLFPSSRAFERGLIEIGYPPALAKTASSFNGIGGARAVLVNAALVDRLTRTERIRLIAHEVGHTLQYQLGGGVRGASEQWLREGFAEWMARRVSARLRLGSLESLRGDLLGALAGARLGLAPAPFEELSTFPQWVAAQGRYEVPLYVQAYIAAELLIEMRGVPAVIRYFEWFKDSQDRERAFVESFGVTPAAFERQFQRRWHETVSRWNAFR